jgi:hypothetical protein
VLAHPAIDWTSARLGRPPGVVVVLMCLGGIRRDGSGSYVMLTPDGCLYGLVDEVAQCLGQLVDGVTHGRTVHITVDLAVRQSTVPWVLVPACTRCGTVPPWPGSESGVHIKAVADLLGHSSIAITGDVYGHTSDDVARAATAGLSGALSL